MFSILVYGRQINEAIDDTTTVFTPKLTVEMGKAGALEFIVPASHFIYGQLFPLVTVITVEYDGREIFRGRILSSERGFNNSRKIYCEGNLAYLVDSQIKGEKYEGNTHDLFRRIVAKHNARVEAQKQFAVGIIGIENRSIILTGQSDQTEDPDTGEIDYKQIAINAITDTWKTSFDYIETCLIDYCGGYLRTRRVGDTTYLDLVTDYGSTSTQEIEFGINLLDLVEGDSADEIFTVLIPLGDDNLDISSVNNGSDELVDAAGVAKYGRIVKTHVFSNVNQASTLLENGQRFLANEQNIPNTFTVKAVDFHLIDSSVGAIFVGDRVHVNSAPHGVSEYMTCTRIEYDLENPENNTYTFGSPHQTLTERYRKDKQQNSGNTGGAGGSGGASAAAAQTGKQDLDEFFNAWINVSPEVGKIDLGAVYEKYVNAETVLKQQVGIDLNAATGNINIKSLREEHDALAGTVTEQGSKIEVNYDNISLVTSWHQALDEREASHSASLTLKANELESSIEANAERIELNAGIADGNYQSLLLLKADQTALDSTNGEVGTLQTAVANLTSRVGTAESKLELTATSQSVTDLSGRVSTVETSVATLSADYVNINSRFTNISSALVVNNGASSFSGNVFVDGAFMTYTNYIGVGGNFYEPVSITSTSGEKTVLGVA